jgi:hypothetical protein
LNHHEDVSGELVTIYYIKFCVKVLLLLIGGGANRVEELGLRFGPTHMSSIENKK